MEYKTKIIIDTAFDALPNPYTSNNVEFRIPVVTTDELLIDESYNAPNKASLPKLVIFHKRSNNSGYVYWDFQRIEN